MDRQNAEVAQAIGELRAMLEKAITAAHNAQVRAEAAEAHMRATVAYLRHMGLLNEDDLDAIDAKVKELLSQSESPSRPLN